jgi:signal transduction histidine kinase
VKRSQEALVWIPAILAAFLLATALSWTALARRMNNDAYDFMMRLHPPPPRAPEAIIAGIDERAFRRGGVGQLRALLAEALEQICTANPAVVAVDVILADPGDPAQNRRLKAAMRQCAKLAIPVSLPRGADAWEMPRPEFLQHASLGHVQALRDDYDAVCREYAVEVRAAGARHWALAVEALRLARAAPLRESPHQIELGSLTIPGPLLRDGTRRIALQFEPVSPEIPIDRLDPARLRGKAVFLGVTAFSAARDRVTTPVSFGEEMPGVQVHAQAYETLARGWFLKRVPESLQLVLSSLLAASAGLLFWLIPGRRAYVFASLLVGASLAGPHLLWRAGYSADTFSPLLSTALPVGAAAALQFFRTRRHLRAAERDRERYQEAIHMVAHEMRSPLTAIQGSSELMGRYALPAEKQRDLAAMIHSESKRLGVMIQTFLDVERLSAGQLDLKQEPVELEAVLLSCANRVRALADKKQIALIHMPVPELLVIRGDRELIEYAVYNLMTNAIKYSPSGTQVQFGAMLRDGYAGVIVKDQGVGMDAREVRQIFRKFYRTPSAERSGEAGTGIGLSLVREIVSRHGGTIEVESAPDQGSRFTIWIPRGR